MARSVNPFPEAFPSHDKVVGYDDERCPYGDCTFRGTSAQVDDHVVYMTSVVQDKDHEERKRR
jgi:hypothetical protein